MAATRYECPMPACGWHAVVPHAEMPKDPGKVSLAAHYFAEVLMNLEDVISKHLREEHTTREYIEEIARLRREHKACPLHP